MFLFRATRRKTKRVHGTKLQITQMIVYFFLINITVSITLEIKSNDIFMMHLVAADGRILESNDIHEQNKLTE